MKTRLRAKQIIIDMPTDKLGTWIHVTVEKVVMEDDGTIVSTAPRGTFIHRALSIFVSQIFQYSDPMVDAGNIKNISGVGIAYAITTAVTKWIAEDLGGVIDEGRVWL